MNENRALYDKTRDERQKMWEKSCSPYVTQPTRKKWEKRYNEGQKAWDELRNKVELRHIGSST